MKALTIKILHVSLAVLLVISTMGVTVEKHYCMGKLKSMAIFQQADNCFGGTSKMQMPCCEDVHEELKVGDLNGFSFDFKLSPQQYQLILVSFPTWMTELNLSNEKEYLLFHESPPPPLTVEIIISQQVFLI